MADLILTSAEARYLARRMPGRALRLRFMEAYIRGGDLIMLPVSEDTLWALDDFLTAMDGQEGRADIRSEMAPDGEPVINVLDKVQLLLVETSYADKDRHPHEGTDADTALHRSEDGEGASSGVSSTKA